MKVSGTELLFALFRRISHSFFGSLLFTATIPGRRSREETRQDVKSATRKKRSGRGEKARVLEHKETEMGISGPIIGPIKHLPRRVAPRTNWHTSLLLFSSLFVVKRSCAAFEM